MSQNACKKISQSLEDYLETILILIKERKIARVKDIAKAKGVKPGSVSPAMKRLSDLQLIRYEQREFIDLTSSGLQIAQKVFDRHQLLNVFFLDVLKMDVDSSQREAASLKHHFSNEGIERLQKLVNYFKYKSKSDIGSIQRDTLSVQQTILDLQPAKEAIVSSIVAQGELRYQLFDLGVLPESKIRMEGTSKDGLGYIITLHGFEVCLNREQASTVMVTLCK